MERRPWVGYGVVGLVALAIGALGIIPFVLANDDGVGVTVFSGILVPLAVVVGWVIAVHGLSRGWRLGAVPAWSLAVVALATPTAGYVARLP